MAKGLLYAIILHIAIVALALFKMPEREYKIPQSSIEVGIVTKMPDMIVEEIPVVEPEPKKEPPKVKKPTIKAKPKIKPKPKARPRVKPSKHKRKLSPKIKKPKKPKKKLSKEEIAKRKEWREKKRKEAEERKIIEEEKRQVLEEQRKIDKEKRRKEEEVLQEILEMKRKEKAERKKRDKEFKSVLSDLEGLKSSSSGIPLSFSEASEIKRQIQRCWQIPPSASKTDKVVLKVKLHRDGSLLSATIVRGSGSGAKYRLLAESAVRAVEKCSPLQNLPPKKFNSWRDMDMSFDPQDLN